MKKMMIRFCIVLSILLGGYSSLYASQNLQTLSPSSKTTYQAFEKSQKENCECKHSDKGFILINTTPYRHFVRNLVELTDAEKEESDKKNDDAKLKKTSAKKFIDYNSYITSLLQLKSSEIESVSQEEKTAPIYSSFCSFSSDGRLYVIFENFRI